MTDTITLTGLVATEPKHLTTVEGLAITSFRLASSLRRFDKKTSTWVDAGTNWYTVSAFRRLALGAAASLNKGDRVIVTGRLRLRDWKTADKAGMSIEIDADALGHDLNWGTASYQRTMSSSEFGEVPPAPDENGPAPDGALSADELPETAASDTDLADESDVERVLATADASSQETPF
jgi:single-strand DNA-binding protein